MGWSLLVGIFVALGLTLAAALTRRNELRRMQRSVGDRDRAEATSGPATVLQSPRIDLTRCLGCGICVQVCPEDDVLDLVHGQAVVVNGARCKGIAACERECPVGAIQVTIANLEKRDDVPAIRDNLEAVGQDGLFLAGEVTAHTLVKKAVEHGTEVAARVAARPTTAPAENVLDLCIVGAGPAGLACSLEAKRHGLDFVTIDQADSIGGTVATYPRSKLVITEALTLPLYGKLAAGSYTKERLMSVWQRAVREHELPIRTGEALEQLERSGDRWVIHTSRHTFEARHVCLALGRRGVPNKLGVPGEADGRVHYGLLDATSYRDRKVLVVGGGDSAVEVALGLAEQPGNDVTLSYRRERFNRIRSAHEKRLLSAARAGKVCVVTSSRVTAIHEDHVALEVLERDGPRATTIANDEVFVMAGGTAPKQLLESAGVSFDPADRAPVDGIAEQGTGFVKSATAACLLATGTLLWALWHHDYYLVSEVERPLHAKHAMLRPGLGIGLWSGIAGVFLIALNLVYLARRSGSRAFAWLRFGSLRAWMTSHVATGVLALLCALVHAGMNTGDGSGGHAMWALVVLLVTGAIGRYLYAYVPRAANGRELELREVRTQLQQLSDTAPAGASGFARRTQREVLDLLERSQWKGTFFGRLLAFVGVQRQLRAVLRRVARDGQRNGIDPVELERTLTLARHGHRTALMAAHFEDLRAILSTWRYVHRWIAALLVLLILVHITQALIYSPVLTSGGTP